MESLIVRDANGKIKKIASDPLQKWLSSYPEKQRSEKRRKLDQFLHYVNQQKGWEGTDYQKLLLRHLESEYEEEVLDLLEEYIQSHRSEWR
jgi:LPS O-antigen subunit length determinant protein (WzzB/FepE family)